ncbi:MAG: hypothetical protein IAG10_24375 [Planctomycetaceae bacterium]|nr:hypothetical protein [Planctomycetaceae bacterium]
MNPFFSETHAVDDQGIACHHELRPSTIIRTLGKSLAIYASVAVMVVIPLMSLVLRVNVVVAVTEWWWVIAIVLCLLTLAHLLYVVKILSRFPRTILLSDDGVTITKWTVSKRFDWCDCHWRIGTLGEDSELLMPDQKVPALILEVRLGWGVAHKFACTTENEVMDLLLAKLKKVGRSRGS